MYNGIYPMQVSKDRLHADVRQSGSPRLPSVTAYGSCEFPYANRLNSESMRQATVQDSLQAYFGSERLRPCPTSGRTSLVYCSLGLKALLRI